MIGYVRKDWRSMREAELLYQVIGGKEGKYV